MPFNSAFGGLTADLPLVNAGFGIKTGYATLLPAGSQVAAYVRSTGSQSGDDSAIGSNLVATLAAGLLRVRSGLGDTVVVLPGHSESVVDGTMLTNMVAGTRVIGWGRGANMPVFRWTAAAASWAWSANDTIIAGLRLRMEGFNGVTKAIALTANDALMCFCDIETVSGASNKVTLAIEIGTGAVGGNRFEFANNIVRGTVAANSTNILLTANTSDQVRIVANELMCSSTTTNGMINIATAVTDIKVIGNMLHNSTAASTTTVAVADVASTGLIADNYSSVENNGVAANQGVVFAGVTTTKIRCFQNFTSDEPGKSGALAPAVVAT